MGKGYCMFDKPIVPLEMQRLSIGDVVDNVWAHNKLFILPRFMTVGGNYIDPDDDAMFVDKSDQSLWADRDNERIVPAPEYDGAPSCIGLLAIPGLAYHEDSIDDDAVYLLADLRYYDAKLPLCDNDTVPDDQEEQNDYYDYLDSIVPVDGFIVRALNPTPSRVFDMYGDSILETPLLMLAAAMDDFIDSITPNEPSNLIIPGQPEPVGTSKKTPKITISLDEE